MVKNTCKQERKTQLQQMGFVQSQVTRETKQKRKKKTKRQKKPTKKKESKIIIVTAPYKNMQREKAASNER